MQSDIFPHVAQSQVSYYENMQQLARDLGFHVIVPSLGRLLS